MAPLIDHACRAPGGIIECAPALPDATGSDPDLEPSPGWSKTGATTRFHANPRSADLEEDETAEPTLTHRQARRRVRYPQRYRELVSGRWQTAKGLKGMARPKGFEPLTPRFVV